MSSRRLPGKALRPAFGKPLLEYLLERLRQSRKLGRIIVATSRDPSDQVIADYCAGRQIECYRGPLKNVALRFKEIVEGCGLDSFIRVCGDSPLMDWTLIDAGIEQFEKGEFDFVTNRLRRTFPKGETLEIMSADTFKKGYERMKTPEDFEHVTWHFYQSPELYRIYNLEAPIGDYSNVNLCVDSAEDLDLFGRMIEKMTRPHWSYNWLECVELQKSAMKDLVKR